MHYSGMMAFASYLTPALHYVGIGHAIGVVSGGVGDHLHLKGGGAVADVDVLVVGHRVEPAPTVAVPSLPRHPGLVARVRGGYGGKRQIRETGLEIVHYPFTNTNSVTLKKMNA